MTLDAVKLANEWDNRTDIKRYSDRSFFRIYKTLEFFDHQHYRQYVPTMGSEHQEFMYRFDKWLENVNNDNDRQVLFEFAPQIIFFGRNEFIKLYQTALQGPITRWVIDKLGLALDDPQLQSKINLELTQHTWYCPITDSMPISDFHHSNSIGGIDFRPDFRSLAKFGDLSKVSDFMRNHIDAGEKVRPLKRLVLLEDFVGVGTQITEATNFAASLDTNVEVLLVPLIICPSGSRKARLLETNRPNVSYSPVLELAEDMFLKSDSAPPKNSLESALKDVLIKTYNKVKGDNAASPRPYSAYGFPADDGTGSTIVMYSNTPANTLPIIQHESNTWNALFRRSARIR